MSSLIYERFEFREAEPPTEKDKFYNRMAAYGPLLFAGVIIAIGFASSTHSIYGTESTGRWHGLFGDKPDILNPNPKLL